jgi:hypothetical protein
MVANAIQRTVAFDREASFADPAAKDWDSLTANGSVFYCFDLTPDDVQQAVIANKNLKPRAAASHAPVLTLRNTPHGLSWYWHSNSANAAEAAQAASIPQDELLLVAMGGEQRGYAAGLAGGTAANPTVEAAHGNNLTPYSFGFFFDTSAGVGWVRQFASVADGGGGADTLTMATGHTLPFTPDAGGADVMNAIVEHWLDWDALEDHTHANHFTLTWFRKGRQADDNLELKGCRHTIEFVPMEAGMPSEIKLEGMADTFSKEGISQPALTGTPAGGPGRIVGSGVTTLMQWAIVGSDLASATFWGAFAPLLGIKVDPVLAPNGSEGLAGFGITEDSYDATMVEMTVPWLDDYSAEFRAGTVRHLMFQLGTAAIGTKFVYFPNLAYAEEPKRVSVGGRAGALLKFVARERDIAQGALTAEQYHRARSKVTIGRTG